MPALTASFVTKTDDFLLGAGKAWKLIKEIQDKVKPLTKASDSLDFASRAMSGTLPAYSTAVDKLQTYVGSQKDKLADLARKDENYWMERSGANIFDALAMSDARNCVDQWTDNFTQLKTLIRQFLPAFETAKKVLQNPGVVGVRSALEESSLPALDGIAMDQIIGDLNNSVVSLDKILPRLQNCRLALR
jgi:hypothetical protein